MEARIVFREVMEGVVHVIFPNTEELAETFVRIGEYYDSWFFRGKIFSLKEFEKWYTINSIEGKKTGKFTYYENSWNEGFNFPSNVLEPFYQGKFEQLSSREKIFLELFKDEWKRYRYIIATSKETNPCTLKHEIAHALFYTNQEYKKEVLDALKKIEPKAREELNGFLFNFANLHSDIWDDEAQAYLVADSECLGENGVDIGKFKAVIIELNNIFDKFFKLK